MEFQTCGLFNVQGSMDFIYVNLSQKDLKSSILVWKDNISKIILFKDTYFNETQSAMADRLRKISNEDAMVKKLEDFLTQNENSVCEINTKLSLEGLQLNLFLDSEEVELVNFSFFPALLFYHSLWDLHCTFHLLSGVEFTCSRLESRPVQANVWRGDQHVRVLQRQEPEDETVASKLPAARHSKGLSDYKKVCSFPLVVSFI